MATKIPKENLPNLEVVFEKVFRHPATKGFEYRSHINAFAGIDGIGYCGIGLNDFIDSEGVYQAFWTVDINGLPVGRAMSDSPLIRPDGPDGRISEEMVAHVLRNEVLAHYERKAAEVSAIIKRFGRMQVQTS